MQNKDDNHRRHPHQRSVDVVGERSGRAPKESLQRGRDRSVAHYILWPPLRDIAEVLDQRRQLATITETASIEVACAMGSWPSIVDTPYDFSRCPRHRENI